MDHNQENSNRSWIIGCLSATAIIIAAIIGLGVPFADRIADVYFPSPMPSVNLATPTSGISNPIVYPPSAPTPTTGISNPIVHPPSAPSTSVELVNREGIPPNSSKTFTVTLGDAEIIVGQSYGFNQSKSGCEAFLIRGPGNYNFSVTDGVWFQYKGVLSSDVAESLLQEQVNTLTANYPCPSAKVSISRLP